MFKPIPPLPRPRRAVRGGITSPSRFQRREPRLPHELDESSDSQASMNADAQRVGKQAARDLERGLVDTDRGPVMEKLMAEHFRSPQRRRRKVGPGGPR